MYSCTHLAPVGGKGLISTKVEYQLQPKALQSRGQRGVRSSRNAEAAGAKVSFRPFVCFTNPLNMKFVIGAYINCIIVSSLDIYAEFLFTLFSSDAFVTVSAAFTNWQRSIGECAESFAPI